MEEPNEWEAYISRNIEIAKIPEKKKSTTYDNLCELCVSTYNLCSKSRKSDLKDAVHFFLEWWLKNKELMNRYHSKSAIGKLLETDHATVIHYIGTKYAEGTRKKSWDFEENTKDIADFLN
jgi:hypothetical protein